MPRPKLYHHRIDVLTTREQWQAIEQYAKRHGLRWGEAVRQLIDKVIVLGDYEQWPAFHQPPLVKTHRAAKER